MRTEGEVLPPGGMSQQVGNNWRKRLIPELLIATFAFGRRPIWQRCYSANGHTRVYGVARCIRFAR
jgi:hypothetical protein